jgi:hypothetical protein
MNASSKSIEKRIEVSKRKIEAYIEKIEKMKKELEAEKELLNGLEEEKEIEEFRKLKKVLKSEGITMNELFENRYILRDSSYGNASGADGMKEEEVVTEVIGAEEDGESGYAGENGNGDGE